jgi:hypothetical protein
MRWLKNFIRFDWPGERRRKASEPDNWPWDNDPPGLAKPTHHGYHSGYTWEAKELPLPGAERYAFETLSLPPFTSIGTGIEPGFKFNPTAPGFVQKQVVPTAGLALPSGGIYGQPLYDPNSGTYSRAVTSSIDDNQPFKSNFRGGALDVQPYGAR